ncbi:hypothetical protein [Nostoc foliaceum]|uniref:hypothetical protein n=1 Tax=Nostoc foliaceum TaxID=2692914 RepID=UPI0028BEAD86|nr:hypothetical protein [Nostoc foliaceum]
MTGDLSPRQDLPPIGGGLRPIGGEREQTDELLPVARSLFPLPKGVDSMSVWLHNPTL